MVRRKIDIELIDDKSKRHTTFTKRRKGLEKKTEELAKKSGSTAALITFSNAGNCYVLGHPDVGDVLDQYEAQSSSTLAAEPGTTSAGERVNGGEKEEEGDAQPPLTEVEKRIAKAVETGRWDEAVRGLGVQELDEFFAEVENIKRRLEARQKKIAAAEAAATAEDSKTSVEEEEESESSGEILAAVVN